MKTILSILILAFVFNSCKKEEPKGLTIDTHISIRVKNKSGMDLLNPSNPGAYLEQDIKIFYLINGVKVRIYNVHYPSFRYFYISEDAGSHGNFWMTLHLNDTPYVEYPITYIQWDENNTDTLKHDVYRTENLVSFKNIWLNDSMVWKSEDYAKGPRNIEIIK